METNKAAAAGEEEVEESTGPSVPELLSFIRSAPSRRRRAARLGFGITMFAGLAVAVLKPPAYVAEVKILAQRNGTLKEVATRTRGDESPTKAAAEYILRRDNLLALIDETSLVEHFEAERPTVLKTKDRAMRSIVGPPKEEDKLRAIVGVLEKKLTVAADETTVTITVEWPNAKTAYDIVTDAQKRFLDGRQQSELGMITEAIGILESHLNTERGKLDEAVAELQHLEEAKRTGEPAAPPQPASSTDAGPAAQPRHVVRLPRATPVATADPERTKSLEEKQRQIASLEADRARRIGDLSDQLTKMRTTLAPAHPNIVALERQLEVASAPDPAIASLKREVAQIEAELSEAHASPVEPRAIDTSPGPEKVDGGSPSIVVFERTDDDASTAVAKQKLANATLKVDELSSRIRAARIELDVAEAAFKYKYSILTPAEVPRDPKKPAPALIGIAGIVAAFLAYFVIPTILDLFSGRLVASWQAKRLGIPLLGELDPPES
jgi:uncharacterized protein involved in exopolysaccharide biosynthesis